MNGITVADLIRLLEQMDPDKQVHMRMDSWSYNEWGGEAFETPNGVYLD